MQLEDYFKFLAPFDVSWEHYSYYPGDIERTFA